MRSVLLLLALALFVSTQEYYDKKYDSFDVEPLVSNKRILKSYANCFLEKGPCTAEGSDFKRIIPEALSTECAKCSPKQRVLIRAVANALKTELPEEWRDLQQKEDPEGKYKKQVDDFLAAED